MLKYAFDQGMGYWEMKACRHDLKWFDFTLAYEPQVRKMLELQQDARLVNIGGWPTDIALHEDQ